ncbi:MAG: hypothetical protein FJ303_02270 [Planctomycetes bacterium]|nr:hypothetical protein [Planctomycetota bacterium]
MRLCAWLALLAACTLTGCSSARIINKTADGGCVAISENSDAWPSYNRTKALDLIGKECPKGYKIIREEEFVTGQTVSNNTTRDTRETPLVKGVSATQTTTQRTTDVRDKTEYRIWYQKTP